MNEGFRDEVLAFKLTIERLLCLVPYNWHQRTYSLSGLWQSDNEIHGRHVSARLSGLTKHPSREARVKLGDSYARAPQQTRKVR